MHYTMYSRESIYTILASSSSISILLLNIMHMYTTTRAVIV